MSLIENLRDAFQRKRYGSEGEYDPDFDLFDAAADEIERLRAALTQFVACCDTAPADILDYRTRHACEVARKALSLTSHGEVSQVSRPLHSTPEK